MIPKTIYHCWLLDEKMVENHYLSSMNFDEARAPLNSLIINSTAFLNTP